MLLSSRFAQTLKYRKPAVARRVESAQLLEPLTNVFRHGLKGRATVQSEIVVLRRVLISFSEATRRTFRSQRS